MIRRIEVPVADPTTASAAVCEALDSSPVVHVVPSPIMDVERSFYDRLAEAMGSPKEIAEDHERGGEPTGERWMEIRYDPSIPDDLAFRFSKNGQPLHTDESYISDPVGVLMMYCVSAARRGGETLFLSAVDLAQHLEQANPELLQRLRTTLVTYQKAGDSRTRPILGSTDSGTTVNFNFYCVDNNQPAAAVRLNREFHNYLATELPPSLLDRVALRPGESVFWRDGLVLHGRQAFVASKRDDRLLWKTAVKLDHRINT